MVLTLVGAPAKPLLDGLLAAVGVAADRLDLSRHSGVHPRVGVADVVPLVPLAGASLADCVSASHSLGHRIWDELAIPVYFYGAAALRPASARLASIRAGLSQPDLGGPATHPTAGAVCVGARGPLVAYNVLLPGADRARAAAIAREMREASSGLAGVQALAFEVGDGLHQLSMNLTRPLQTPIPVILARVLQLHPGAGPDEVVGCCPAAAAGPTAAGLILEYRLAAGAASAGARLAADRGGVEHSRLATKLSEESGRLGDLGITTEDFLSGAERAYAILRVLRAAGVATPALEIMLDTAARGLRGAAGNGAALRYPDRVRLLDSWLR